MVSEEGVLSPPGEYQRNGGSPVSGAIAKGGRVKSVARVLWLPAVLLVAWQAAAALGWLDTLFFPAPSTIAAATVRMARTGELWGHLAATLSRMAGGLVIGSALGVPFGILLATVGRVRRAAEPFVSALNSMPKLTLLPMLMLFFGIGEAPRMMLIAAGCFLTMTIQSMDAVGGIHRAFVELAVNYGANRAALWRKVYVPSALPQVFTGLRLALGRALTLAVSVELVSSGKGLGSLIWSAWQTFSIDKLYVGVALAAALGMTLHLGLKRLETYLVPWR
jgi:NitT/TauT family transport system permease protein